MKIIEGDVSLYKLYLENLPDLSDVHVYGSFSCQSNRLTTLKGSPTLSGNFYCNDNRLISLEGCPEIIYGNLNCSYNRLETLERFPKFIMGSLHIYNNTRQFTDEEIREVCDVRGMIYV